VMRRGCCKGSAACCVCADGCVLGWLELMVCGTHWALAGRQTQLWQAMLCEFHSIA
jgi:hypothetical protein